LLILSSLLDPENTSSFYEPVSKFQVLVKDIFSSSFIPYAK
jgi:hypothetical protein